MRDAKLRLVLLGILLLAVHPSPCQGLCSLVNGTVARCHYLEDARYIDTYDLGTLRASTTESRLEPEVFRNLTSLRHLELTHGELQHIESQTFLQLRQLRSLDLSNNKISTLDSSAFDGLKKLHSLSLRKNALTEIPSAVLSLKSLKFLDISGNPIACTCRALKVRDLLVNQGVLLNKRILCSSPANLRGKSLVEPDTQVICMFEDQDDEMQMDQPALEGSGEVPSGDPFDDQTPDDLDEVEHEVTTAIVAAPEEVETPAPIVPDESSTAAPSTSSSSSPEVPAIQEKSTTAEDEMYFSEESVSQASTSPLPSSSSSTETTEEVISTASTDEVVSTASTDEVVSTASTKDVSTTEETLKSLAAIPVEGSGEDEDLLEGSGIEGSGTGVPPISWDVPDDETMTGTASTGNANEEGWFSLLWDTLAGTSAPPEDDTTKDLNLQEEEFISASTETPHASSSRSPDEIIVPVDVAKSDAAPDKNVEVLDAGNGGDDNLGRALDEAKSGQVKAEAEGTAEAADASLARQPQKGMGSYVVLAVLLAILGALIGFAAYKGEFCTKKRKRNDVEGGTELKDMTKSLLDTGNAAQPKIASNGNLENVPLVSAQPQGDFKPRGGPADGSMKYSAVPDVVDPVKPPRKSYVSPEDPERAMMTNGRSHQDLVDSSAPPEVTLRAKEPAVNGKNRHDSVSSLGTDSRGSPSVRTSPPLSIPTNGSLGNLQGIARPPLSPGAQRVKITLQDNPDSLPKTPILITRTKAGENLVKTP